MDRKKLVETRGEEPTFLPGHVGESWQRVDFGLGASTMRSSPEVQAALPPRSWPWGRMVAFALVGGLGVFLLITVIRLLPR